MFKTTKNQKFSCNLAQYLLKNHTIVTLFYLQPACHLTFKADQTKKLSDAYA